MSQQSVKAHADAETSTYPVKYNCGKHSGPTPEKERCNRSKMCKDQENSIRPINAELFSRSSG
jgi:hypothetical protein